MRRNKMRVKKSKVLGRKSIRILKICIEKMRASCDKAKVLEKQRPYNTYIQLIQHRKNCQTTVYFSDIPFSYYADAFKCNLHKCGRTTELIYHIQ